MSDQRAGEGGNLAPRSASSRLKVGWNSEDPIRRALSRLHDSIASEPLPDDFLDLIAQIDRKVIRKDRK